MGQRAQRQQQGQSSQWHLIEWKKIVREVLEICCWKERKNGAESAKTTIGGKAASETDGRRRNRQRSPGDMLFEREEWAERAKAITGGKAAWKETKFCRM